MNVVVDQPDGIAGFVRFGKIRLADAVLLVFLLGGIQPDGIVTETIPSSGWRRNLWGGFEFDGLADGKVYVLVIGPAGWAEKYIEVGNLDATIKLSPWWSATP